MIPFSDQYSGAFMNPADDLNPEIKKGDAQWFLKKGKWIMSEHLRGRTWIPFASMNEWQEARLYAQGRQSAQKYKEWMYTKRQRQDSRKGWINISWDIFPIYPKFRNKILGLFEDADFFVSAQAIDEKSAGKIEDKIATNLFHRMFPDFVQAFEQNTGLNVSSGVQEDRAEPETFDDADFWRQMGAFKLKEEIAIEKFCKWSEKLSQWPVIKKQVFEDLIDGGCAVVKDYTDPQTQKVMLRYVDPEYAIIRKGRSNTSADITEAGEIKWFSLATLRDLGVSDKDLLTVARAYYSQSYNSVTGTLNSSYGQLGDNYDQERHGIYKCAVLDFEFESVDTMVYRVREGNDGIERAYEEPYNKDGKLSGAMTTDAKKMEKQKRRRWYRGKWVIGTDIVFDYGYQKDVPIVEETPRSSFSCFRVSDRGITSMCIATIDEIQMDILTIRNTKSKAAPSGVLVEWGALSEITLSGAKQQPLDLLTMRNQTGDLLFRIPRDKNGMALQGITNPIMELKGGMGPIFTELCQSVDRGIQSLQLITGVNAVVDASNPAPNTLVGVAEIAQQSTNDVLKPILGAYRQIKHDAFNKVAVRWQCVAKFAPEKFKKFGEAVGYGSVSTVLASWLTEDLPSAKFAIDFEMIVDGATKQRIDQAAMASITAAKQGQPGISMSDYFFILRLLEMGNIKYAQNYLAYSEKKAKEAADKLQADNMKLNGENMQKQEEMKGQNQKAAQDAATESALMQIREKHKGDMELEKLKLLHSSPTS